MNKFKFGDKVWHSKFGFGVITSNRQQDDDYAYIDVTFIEYKGSEYKEYVPVEYLTPASDWVKCSERMPPKSGVYLCILKSKYNDFTHVAIVDFYDDDFDVGIASNVIGWMPLPAPPVEVEQ